MDTGGPCRPAAWKWTPFTALATLATRELRLAAVYAPPFLMSEVPL